jgi:hypothetical protein
MELQIEMAVRGLKVAMGVDFLSRLGMLRNHEHLITLYFSILLH